MAHNDNSKPGLRRPAQARRPRPVGQKREATVEDRMRQSQEDKLDEALIESFPASDPAVSTPRKS